MVQFNVDSAQVAHGALAARRHGEAIRGEVQAMTALLTQMEGTWRGGAATAFQSALGQWRGTQQKGESAVEAIATAVDAAGRHDAHVAKQKISVTAGGGRTGPAR